MDFGSNCSNLSPKKAKKKTVSDLNFGPADNKNAIKTQSMGGINIWEKLNFFRPFVSKKDAKKV